MTASPKTMKKVHPTASVSTQPQHPGLSLPTYGGGWWTKVKETNRARARFPGPNSHGDPAHPPLPDTPSSQLLRTACLCGPRIHMQRP